MTHTKQPPANPARFKPGAVQDERMIPMVPLLSEMTYASLLSLREQMHLEGIGPCGGVMLPHGVIDGEAPRVLWIGQALLGEPREDTTWTSAGDYADWVPGLLDQSSPFWRFIRRTMMKALKRHGVKEPITSQDIVQHIGWTNLALIANTAAGNPEGPLRERQTQLCGDALRETIETMRPTAIVALVNEYGPGILERGIGSSAGDWQVVDPAVEPLEAFTRPDGIRVFWTIHPRNLNIRGSFDAVSDRIACEV